MRQNPSLRAACLGIAAVALVGAGSIGCRPAARSNLVIITIDTTRADHLSAYGYSKPTTPQIERFADEAVLFESAYSHVPITLPSHTSIMTGTFPTFHGVRDNNRFVVDTELVTLAEMLRDQGYSTAAFVSAFVLDSRFGLDQGFDVYDDNYGDEWSEEDLREARVYSQMVVERPADQTTARALDWLEERDGGPFFLWIHYYDPHQRYDPPHPWRQLYEGALYDGEIAFTDEQIGRVFTRLREQGLWDQTAIVFTADHGEGLGQHGEATHAILAHDATLHVPLVIKPPATATGISASVVDQTVSHVDLLPTLAELLAFELPPVIHGTSLVPAMRGRERRPSASYFECNLPAFGFGWQPLFGVRDTKWKYIHSSAPELYASEDRGEVFNRFDVEPQAAAEMEALLFRIVEGTTAADRGQREASIDDDVRAKLDALGYVAGTGSEDTELNPRIPPSKRHPQDGVELMDELSRARGYMSNGRYREALDIVEHSLLEIEPDNPEFLTTAADLRRRLGSIDVALELYQRAQALDPNDARILTQIGQLEMDQGHLDAAEDLLIAAVQLAPTDLTANYLSALVAVRREDYATATERYEKVLELDASHRDTLINLGVQHGRLGDHEAGRRYLQQALSLAPFSTRALYNLGLLEYQAGDVDRAVGLFESAVKFRDDYLQARMGLAVALRDQGATDRARAELQALLDRTTDESVRAQASEILSTL